MSPVSQGDIMDLSLIVISLTLFPSPSGSIVRLIPLVGLAILKSDVFPVKILFFHVVTKLPFCTIIVNHSYSVFSNYHTCQFFY